MIVQKELDEERVTEIANEILGGLTQDVTDLQNRVNNLAYNADLIDVNMSGLGPGQVPKWNGTSWVPSDDSSGIPDVMSSANHVRQNGYWQPLSTASEISALGTDITNLEISQATQDLELLSHENRITALETSNPESLRGLTDTNFGTLPNAGKDGYVVKYDFLSDKFLLNPDNSGLPDAPIDGLPYVRKDETWVDVSDNVLGIKNLSDVSDTMLPSSGQLLSFNGTAWDAINPPNTFPEAPADGQGYLRRGDTNSWEALGDNILIQTYGTLINSHTSSINTLNSGQTTQNN